MYWDVTSFLIISTESRPLIGAPRQKEAHAHEAHTLIRHQKNLNCNLQIHFITWMYIFRLETQHDSVNTLNTHSHPQTPSGPLNNTKWSACLKHVFHAAICHHKMPSWPTLQANNKAVYSSHVLDEWDSKMNLFFRWKCESLSLSRKLSWNRKITVEERGMVQYS